MSSNYPPPGRSSEDPQVISDPDFTRAADSTYTPPSDHKKVTIVADVTALIKHNLDDITSTSSPPSYEKAVQMVIDITKQFNASGIRSFRNSKDPLVVEFELKKKFYELVFAVMDKWMTDEPITKDKMYWIAYQVNFLDQHEIPEKYKVWMINNATFMNYVDYNQSDFNRLFRVLQELKKAQQQQSVSSVAAATPVASTKSAKQEAADRLLQLIEGLTIDELMRQQAITYIATLLNMSTNGGSRKRRNIKPKKSKKSRKTKSRKTKHRKMKSRRH